ncbi:hypothetical protein EV670_0840 [Rivibacter subsaxonicus]|uniref:Transmembrane protein n=1 Tax=Rivibacter subsaxonicus TaxID=457575 RepID=A0A4Q7W0T5_9BURK|nr:hypothetical protein EV670_0840 [Rivibacter subsaxonicus]
MSVTVRLKPVPARQGLAWVREGFRNFFRQPLGYTAIFSVVGVAVLLLLQIPLVGAFAALALMPAATLGFMAAGRAQRDGKLVHPGQLLQPWRDPAVRSALLRLGVVYAIAAYVSAILISLFDGDAFETTFETLAKGEAGGEALQSGAFQFSLLLRLGLASLMSLVFWHAPALVAWNHQPLAKALFASTLACWRALGAYALMGAAWFGVLMLFMTLAQIFFVLIGNPQGVFLAAIPAGLMFSTAFYASLFATYADSFETEAAAPIDN